MSCSSWFSPDDFDRYSVLKSVLWSVSSEESPARDCSTVEKKVSDSEAVKRKVSGIPSRRNVVPIETETRAGRVREPHSSSRIGMDKLQVRASADAPYDLDVAAVDVTVPACGAWFAPRADDLRRKHETADHADVLAPGEDQFEAKLNKFRGFTSEQAEQ
jgi:hypothetical protein